MKKILAMGLILALCLCGCGEEQKAKVNLPEEKYDALVTMTQVVDSYLDMEITATEANKKLQQLDGRIDVESIGGDGSDLNLELFETQVRSVYISISYAANHEQIVGSSADEEDMKELGENQNDILRSNNEIKEALGI